MNVRMHSYEHTHHPPPRPLPFPAFGGDPPLADKGGVSKLIEDAYAFLAFVLVAKEEEMRSIHTNFV